MMETSDTVDLLFGGEYINFRLTNEDWLLANCPKQFFNTRNPWTAYTSKVVQYRSASFLAFRFKRFHPVAAENEAIRDRRMQCFVDVLRAPNSIMTDKQRAAVSAWMLTHMLVTPPTWYRS